MLDLIVCSASIHKQIQNFYTTIDRDKSDHQAVHMELNITSIKFKGREGTEFNKRIDWRKIEKDEQCRTTYNNTLRDMTSPDMSYTDFFNTTIQARKWTASGGKKD
jgi:hypothetical protein